jgi:hypothetical protein
MSIAELIVYAAARLARAVQARGDSVSQRNRQLMNGLTEQQISNAVAAGALKAAFTLACVAVFIFAVFEIVGQLS